MVDLHEMDKGNVSLPPRLKSPEIGENLTPEDAENLPTIINTQRAVYDTIIEDLRNRIERLQMRNEKLEKFCDLAKSYSGETTAEVESIIVELNNNIEAETKKINDSKKMYNEIEVMREEQKSKHTEKVKLLEEKFEKTRVRLLSEIKTINAKVNTIEDFKSSADYLKEKYDNQHQSLLQKEEEIQQTLKQIQFKSLEHRENLRKEAYKGIFDVSENFQLELQNTVPKTTQRLMRETIILENELVRLGNDFDSMSYESLQHKTYMNEWNEKIENAKKDKKNHVHSIKIQNTALQKLKSNTIRMKSLKRFQKPEGYEKKCLQLLEKMRSREFLKKDYYRRELEVAVHRENIKCNLAKESQAKILSALNICYSTLRSLKYIVDTLDTKNMDFRTFAYYLLDVLDDYDTKKTISDSELLESATTSISTESNVEIESIETKDEDASHIEIIPKTSIVSEEQQLSNEHDSVLSDISADTSPSSEKVEEDRKTLISFKEMKLTMEDGELEENYYKYQFQDAYEDFLNYGK